MFMYLCVQTVCVAFLLRRLEACFGVTGSALSWISSYLSDRSQFVRLDSFLSPVESCFCGVPQGSVLGPLLFVAYTAPMSTIADHFGVQYHQYADDTQIYVALSKDGINETTANLQNCLAEVHLWLSQNGLVINPDKSEAVLFSDCSAVKNCATASVHRERSWCGHADSGRREIVGRHTRSTPDIQQTHTECMWVVLLSHPCTEAHPVITFGRCRQDNRVRVREFSTRLL